MLSVRQGLGCQHRCLVSFPLILNAMLLICSESGDLLYSGYFPLPSWLVLCLSRTLVDSGRPSCAISLSEVSDRVLTTWQKLYLDRHAWQGEIIQSFLPTMLVSLLALLIPVILFFIAKKAHTVTTLSALHDLILTRYYKFLVVNVLVFFCVGTAALQSFLLSFRSPTSLNLIQIVADSFPSAGPFYVGWCEWFWCLNPESFICYSDLFHLRSWMFWTSFRYALRRCDMHIMIRPFPVGVGDFVTQTTMFWRTLQLPLLTYPSMRRQITPYVRFVNIWTILTSFQTQACRWYPSLYIPLLL